MTKTERTTLENLVKTYQDRSEFILNRMVPAIDNPALKEQYKTEAYTLQYVVEGLNKLIG